VGDADRAECAALSAALSDAGYSALCASTLKELEALIERNACELVVCDSELLAHDCSALVRRLRERLGERAAPVVILSEERDMERRLDALRAGAMDYLVKPIDVTLLMRVSRGQRSADQLGGPSRVLVVDDSTTYGQALADELSLDGHDVVLAVSVAEARAYLAWQRPDLALLDVFLPDGDGVELAKSMRASESTRELPILLLTGRESTNVRQRAAEAQVSGFAAKDTPLAELRKSVAALKASGRARPFKAPPVEPRAVSGRELFLRVVAASGLSEVLGRSTLELALKRAGIETALLTPENLRAALPHVEQALVTFLPPGEARARLAAVAALATEGPITS
jgi:DNA-binding response OmpR family regulator